jgi:hypothetical protein
MLLPVNLRTLPNRQGDLASDWWSHVTVDKRAGKDQIDYYRTLVFQAVPDC